MFQYRVQLVEMILSITKHIVYSLVVTKKNLNSFVLLRDHSQKKKKKKKSNMYIYSDKKIRFWQTENVKHDYIVSRRV